MNSVVRASTQFSLAVLVIVALAGCGAGQPDAEAGVLRIATEPGGAELFIDGASYGDSPVDRNQSLVIKLPAGEYVLEARKAVDPFSEYHGVRQYRHVADRPMSTVTLTLERRHTEAGRERLDERSRRVAAHEQSALARFVPHDDGTVTDIESGLMWMRCSVGQTWADGTCNGDARQLNWDRAMKVAGEFTLADKSDWRLPTQPELYELTFCSSGLRSDLGRDGMGGGCLGDYRHPTILESIFPNTPSGNYWSSTPHEKFAFSAWGVAFHTGHTGTGGRSDFIHVRLVRDPG
jgi:hypothetical protein